MGKVTFEFDENKESHDIELIVNRYKMICALDELEKYRYDLYNGHREEVFYVKDDKKTGTDDNKTIEDIKKTRECIEVKDVLMDCDKDNPASSRTMIALGGKLIKEYYDDENAKCIVQDYIINVDEAIENNKEKYENKINYKR